MNNVDTMYWHESRAFKELGKNTKKQKYDYVTLFFLDSKGRNKPQVHFVSAKRNPVQWGQGNGPEIKRH